MQVLLLLAAILFALNQVGLLQGQPPSVRITRITGDDPITVAATAARESYGGEADTVVLVGAEALADGVVASGLAGALDAPILLNELNRLSSQTRDIIRELDATRVVMIGGTGAMRAIVQRTLAEDLELDVLRIAGASRFDTADRVAQEFASARSAGVLGGLPTALVVPAEDVAAGLAAGGLAAGSAGPLPVLYSQDGALPQPTLDALDRLGIQQLIAAAVTTGFDGPVVTLTDPVAIANRSVELRGFQPSRIVVVPDGDDARALIGAAVAGRESGVILPASQAEGWLIDNCGTLDELFVIAEDDVVTDLDVARLEQAATVCA